MRTTIPCRTSSFTSVRTTGRRRDLDAGRYTITVTSKGSRARETVPASVDSFVWLALYLADQRPSMSPGGPLLWTRRSTPAPLSYHAMRAVLRRANDGLGTNWSCTISVTPPPRGCWPIPRSRWSTYRPYCGIPASRPPRSTPNRGWKTWSARSWSATPNRRYGADDRAELRRGRGSGAIGASAEVTIEDEDPRPQARRQAAATRAAAAPPVALLSRPDSPHQAAIPPDDRFGRTGKLRIHSILFAIRGFYRDLARARTKPPAGMRARISRSCRCDPSG